MDSMTRNLPISNHSRTSLDFTFSTEETLYSVWDFERIDLKWWRTLFKDYWWTSLYISAVYLVLVFWGQSLMKDRRPFNLRGPLFLWNLGLAIFSIIGTARSIPEFYQIFTKENPIYNLVCSREVQYSSSILWYILFNLSKPAELGDTAFIVLRKQKLLFLHWYHHISVMVLNWYIVSFYCPLTRLFTIMNYFVHSLMYSYYAAKAAKIRVPKPIAVSITLLQITQMFFGLTSTMYLHWNITQGNKCDTSLSEALMGYVVYCPYLVLFLHFFYLAYFPQKKSQKLQ